MLCACVQLVTIAAAVRARLPQCTVHGIINNLRTKFTCFCDTSFVMTFALCVQLATMVAAVRARVSQAVRGQRPAPPNPTGVSQGLA